MSKVRIKPFVDRSIFNMGLERYDQNMIDGANHRYSVYAYNYGGVDRYKTGLDIHDPALSYLSDTEREAKIKTIKETLIKLERALGGAVVNPDDPDWFNKIVKLSPTNKEFWESDDVAFKVDTRPYILNLALPLDQLKMQLILAGGIPEIATSLEVAMSSNKPVKAFLDNEVATTETRIAVSKLRNLAGAKLEEISNKSLTKLLYITKLIDPNSAMYKKSTPAALLYDACDKYINGELLKDNKKQSAERFLEIAEFKLEDLKLQALVKDAIHYRVFVKHSDGNYWDKSSTSNLGNTLESIIEFLKSPVNDAVYRDVVSKVEQYWQA